MSWRDGIRHAFAVESSDSPPEPTPEQRAVIDRWCASVVRRKFYNPALRLVGQELAQPLNYVTSQAMHFFRPALRAVAPDRFVDDYSMLASFLEHRGSTTYIAERLAALEAGDEPATAVPTDGGESMNPSDHPESGVSSPEPPTSQA